MLLVINVLIGLIIKQLVEWLATIVAGALDICYAFPFGLISSEGEPHMVPIGMRCKWSGEVIHSFSAATRGVEDFDAYKPPPVAAECPLRAMREYWRAGLSIPRRPA